MFSRKKRSQKLLSDVSNRPVVKNVVPLEIPPYYSLMSLEVKGSRDGVVAHALADDIYLLLMQKDYDNRSSLEYANFIQSFSSKLSEVNPVNKPKMTDEQLFQYVKSRHCQQPSEVKAWFDYLCGQYDIVKSELDAKREELLQQQREGQQSGEQQQETLVQGTSSAS